MKLKGSNLVMTAALGIGILLFIIGWILAPKFDMSSPDIVETTGYVYYNVIKDDDGTTYNARVSYYVNDKAYTYQSHINSSKELHNLSKGTEVKVYYDKNNPEDSYVPDIGKIDKRVSNIIKAIAIGFFVLAFLPLIKLILKAGIFGICSTNKKNKIPPTNNNQTFTKEEIENYFDKYK